MLNVFFCLFQKIPTMLAFDWKFGRQHATARPSSKARIFCASASQILISELSELQDINSRHTGQSDLLQRDSIDAEK